MGIRIYNRKTGKSERARKEFDVLALPTTTPDGRRAYSIKMRDEIWFVLLEDLEG